MLAALWAQDQQGVIGKEGSLPWHLPNDLKFFKEQTMNHTIIMGRKTFEGMGCRLLPNRTTVVLTSDTTYQAPAGVIVLHSREAVIDYVAKTEDAVFLIGGAGVFASLLSECTHLYRTMIEGSFEGDVFFPEECVNWQEWTLEKLIPGVVDEQNHYPHRFEIYRKA